MTTAEGTSSNAGKVSELEHAVNGAPVLSSSTAGFDTAAAAPAAGPALATVAAATAAQVAGRPSVIARSRMTGGPGCGCSQVR